MEAEQEANRLVEELTRLKNESESYRAARGTLEKAGDGVARLGGELADAAHHLDGMIETLRAIGTSELLRTQEAATAEVAALRRDLASTRRAMDASTTAQGQAIEATTRELRASSGLMIQSINALRGLISNGQGAAKAEVTAIRTELANTRRAMEATIAAQGKTLDVATRELQSSRETAAQAIRTLRSVVLIGMGMLLAGIIALAAVIAVRG